LIYGWFELVSDLLRRSSRGFASFRITIIALESRASSHYRQSTVGQNPTANAEIRLSLVGDWGTGTHEAAAVAEGILGFKPHFTIHLGDVYYIGDQTEINEHCLNTPARSSQFEAIEWPHGSLGSYAQKGMVHSVQWETGGQCRGERQLRAF
jgi:hypothetical protein